MGYPPSVENFDYRKIAQKAIYLADSKGAYCGDFMWNWYKNGPYSPALTALLYDNQQVSATEIKRYTISDEIKEILLPIKKVIQLKPFEMSDADWMELIASIHYIYYKLSSVKTKQHVVDMLIKKKTQYSLHQANYAYNVLKELEILN